MTEFRCFFAGAIEKIFPFLIIIYCRKMRLTLPPTITPGYLGMNLLQSMLR
ncbi:MAG TPA: hypothetical protein VJ624_06670 [Thermodesulfobacteriota bacterium]|nr:hypothetical protein [Thermodesulfobacteriota bacterium]